MTDCLLEDKGNAEHNRNSVYRMECPDCGTELLKESKFCKECGRRLNLVCEQCGNNIPFDSKFCTECGHDIRKAATQDFCPYWDSKGSCRYWIRHALSVEGKKMSYGEMLDHFSGLIVMEALRRSGGNRSHSAKLLSLSRPTLVSKIEKHGLKYQFVAEPDEQKPIH